MEEKLIPLSEDVEQTSLDIRDTMYQNLLSKGVEGVIPSMDVEALAKLILSVPDRAGMNGWTLVPALALDGDRCVFKIAGWLLNDGSPPPSNMYLGYTGIVADIKDGINIRGRDGLTTSVSIGGRIYTQVDGNIVLPDLLPSSHNISITSHEDLRAAIANLQVLLESDDTTLDELKEIVTYIKDNRGLIEVITAEKISYSDIVDNLNSTGSDKPLSANMGRDLAAKIGAKQDKGDYATSTEVEQKISDIALPDVSGAVGQHNISATAHNDIRALINAKASTTLGNVTTADFSAKANSAGITGELTLNDKIANRDLWDGLKGHYISIDTSAANTIYERLYLTSGNVLKATLTTSFSTNITETLAVVGGASTTKVITFNGNIIKETIS